MQHHAAPDDTPLPALVDALRIAERRFRTAINASFDAFLFASPVRDAHGTIVDLTIVEANERAAQLADTTVDAMVGASLTTIFPHTRTTDLWEQCLRVIETHAAVEVTQAISVVPYGDRWVERQLLPLEDGVAISSRDVTARNVERLALEASEARHRGLFESNDAVQLVVDAETGALVDANPAAEQFYGWPRATLMSMLITDIESTTLDAWMREARPSSHEHPRREHAVASGARRFVEAYHGQLEVNGRRLVHMIVQDISARVEAETRLRDSEAIFRAVVNGMRDGVVLHDTQGRILMSNPSAQRLLGVPASADGVNAWPWRAVHEDGTAWPPHESPAMIAIETNASQPVSLMGLEREGAEPLWVRVCADPLVHEGEVRPYAAVTLFADVTDVRSAEERLREAQKLEAVGQLAGGIAHDFNNALTVIRGSTGFLQEVVRGQPAMDDVAAIERATDRAEILTRQLLAFARKQPLRLEPTSLNTLVREYGVTLRESLPASIRIAYDLSTEPSEAMVDRRRVLDALRVLVENARTVLPTGGTLTLATRRVMRATPRRGNRSAGERPFVELSVRDDGPGMSEDTRAHLFEPFFSTQPFGAGRGMGLPSVHGMMAQTGGAIECESALGAGTVFRLLFPAAAER